MFGGSKKTTGRRKRARQFRVESTESPWVSFTRRVGLFPSLVWTVFLVLVMLIAFAGEPALPYKVNEKIGQPIRARVNFSRVDPELANANIRAAREAVPNHYRINVELIDRIASVLSEMFEAAQAPTYEAYEQKAKAGGWPANESFYQQLSGADERRRKSLSESIERLKADLALENTALPTARADRDPPSTSTEVVIQRPSADGSEVKTERVASIELVQIASNDAVEGRALKLAAAFDRGLRPTIAELLTDMLGREPILVFDRTRTLESMAEAERNAPPGERLYEKGKPFVFPRTVDGSPTGEETGLTLADIELLKLENARYLAFLESDDPEAIELRHAKLLEFIGVGMIAMVLTVALFMYVGLYHHRILEVATRAFAFCILLLACLAAVRFLDPRFVLTPVLLVASILTIAYPQRFAAGVTVIFVVVVAIVMRADRATMVTLFVAGYVTAMLLHDIRTRTRIVSSGVLTGGLVFFISFAFGLIDHQETAFTVRTAGIAASNAILAALILQGVLPFVERVFRVATPLTLMEYRDANRPLLQRLAREAPGTYNHSLVLGTMAEAACKEIGANGLLAHVGALYHDIGKITKAEYFSENQEAAINRHDKLAPTMSLLIILGHVKDGLELAREYGLPRVLYPFIAEHHGTTVVRYFHHMASEKQPQIASGRHDREVAEAEFRYPGPKPQSKETAVLMLCDGVEGAVRALHEPTAGRIESIVHQVLQARLKDGQFDECDITLRELHKVEESVVKSLCTFYHGRVAYPKEPSKSERKREDAQPQQESAQLAG